MRLLTRRKVLAGMAALPLASTAQAALQPYILSTKATVVGFTFDLSGIPQTGSMPIRQADVQIDMHRLQNSQVTVVLDVNMAKTRLPFARMPMLGPSVLDTKTFPTI
ncbi:MULTISPECIES: hypothetical protein [unclassified Ruegeria]|nr:MULTISPECIES: hypothetical protein [unclassified Ruegeria]